MASAVDELQAALTALDETGDSLLDALLESIQEDEVARPFFVGYEAWYTESQRVVGQLIPERLPEFTSHYRPAASVKELTWSTYTISDFLQGTTVYNRVNQALFDTKERTFFRFQSQLEILRSASLRFSSSLMDLRELVQADLFDNELEKARALLKNGLLREAGVVSGVVLEEHLQHVAGAHQLKIRKAHPTIADLNDPLKAEDVYNVPTWRLIQRLADIRNLCDHRKDRDPSKDEVGELIDGVEKITKTVF